MESSLSGSCAPRKPCREMAPVRVNSVNDQQYAVRSTSAVSINVDVNDGKV